MTSAKSEFGSILLLPLSGPVKIFQQKSQSFSFVQRKFLVLQVANAALATEIQDIDYGSFERCHFGLDCFL